MQKLLSTRKQWCQSDSCSQDEQDRVLQSSLSLETGQGENSVGRFHQAMELSTGRGKENGG
jgi:hypothetical protein